jgi:putative hydrolase of the HAD superfamily
MHAIIFDIGNVLVGYDHAQTLAAVAASFDITPDDLHHAYRAVGRQFGLGQLQPAQVCDFLNQQFEASISLEQFATAFCAGLTRDDTALSYVNTLQVEDELFIGAISNTNATHVAWLDAHVPELNNFELVVMSNEVALLKPDAEIFELALELLDVPASHALYIDDSAENVAAAQSLGMETFVHTDWEATRLRIEAWCNGWRTAATAT